MAKIIVWTKKAESSFNHVILYLENEWNDDVIRKFVTRFYHVIELLSEYPEIGTVEDVNKNIRNFLITKHNMLFYRTTETQIILLNIFDTRFNPKRPKY